MRQIENDEAKEKIIGREVVSLMMMMMMIMMMMIMMVIMMMNSREVVNLVHINEDESTCNIDVKK